MSSEFEFLDHIRKKFSLGKIGDDCAVLPKDADTDMVITADMLVEDIDFRLEWAKPEDIGHKALAVSLSDIAAMGANPTWAMLSIGVPEHIWNTDFLDAFYDGWHTLAAEFGVELVGGDVSRTPEKIVVDSIAGGEVGHGRAILRSTAKAGDLVFVTGELGAASVGLAALQGGPAEYDDPTKKAILRQLRPAPQVAAGKWLQQQQLATAMIDISDGLSSDLAHICDASGVGAVIHSEKIPCQMASFAPERYPGEHLKHALNGGEDFELLFTSGKKNISTLENAGFMCIGEITANVGIIELMIDGRPHVLKPAGYRHF